MIRKILEAIAEVELDITPEFQKQPAKKPTSLMDTIGDYVDMEVISINDFGEEPESDVNPVVFPGNTTKYSLSDPKLYNAVHERVQKSGVWWVNDMTHGVLKLSPTDNMSVPVFWNRIYNLVSWFLEQPGGGVDDEDDDDSVITYVVVIDGPHFVEDLGTFDTFDDAKAMGEAWKAEVFMNNPDDDHDELDEDYTWELRKVFDDGDYDVVGGG